MKALQGYGVNANAQETTLKKDRKYFMPYRPTRNDPMYLPHRVTPNGQ